MILISLRNGSAIVPPAHRPGNAETRLAHLMVKARNMQIDKFQVNHHGTVAGAGPNAKLPPLTTLHVCPEVPVFVPAMSALMVAPAPVLKNVPVVVPVAPLTVSYMIIPNGALHCVSQGVVDGTVLP
jgi:hypothetical protein